MISPVVDSVQMNSNIASSWSGGKDSCYALMLALKEPRSLRVIINVMNENGRISRSHGLPLSILQQQANAMNVPLVAVPASWNEYEKNYVKTLQLVKEQYEISSVVFGDIDLQEHRDWEEMVCRKVSLTAVLPVWKKLRKEMVIELIEAGVESVIVSCNTTLGEDFLGRTVNNELIPELEAKGVDVCGENGEFHTVVVNCPLFKERIKLPKYRKVLNADYWFCEFEPGFSTLDSNL